MDINDYKSKLVDMEINNINKVNNGFIDYNCYTIMQNHLVDCLINKSLFNDVQLNNIYNFIDKIENENN